MVVMGSFTGFQVRVNRETAGRNRDTVDEVQFAGVEVTFKDGRPNSGRGSQGEAGAGGAGVPLFPSRFHHGGHGRPTVPHPERQLRLMSGLRTP